MKTATPGVRRGLVLAALFALYFIWGSTYLAIRYAIEGFPPLMMAGIRFLVAGGLFFVFLRLRGAALPSLAQWRSATISGGLLLLCGNGAVAVAEQWISSGVAALAIATVPLWTVLFARGWGQRSSYRDWLGIVLGFFGVLLLALGGNMQASPLGAMLLLFAAASWSFGSVWSKHLPMPIGLMSSAAQMLAGGALLVIASALFGESVTAVPSAKAIGALLYLIVFGSIVAFTSYQFLLHQVRPALATSYAYVNPVVALLLGWQFAGEYVGSMEWLAMAVITGGVCIVMLRKQPATV